MKKKTLGIIAMSALAAAAGIIYFNGSGDWGFSPHGWGHMGGGFFDGHLMAGGILHMVVWFFVIYFIVSAVAGSGRSYRNDSDSADEILKKKFVNGDISKTEFTEKLRYLNDIENRRTI